MDRRRVAHAVRTALAVALLGLALGGCSNSFDIVGAIQNEVMVANGKFLVIKSAAPAKNATNVNPSDSLWFEMDRALDTDTVTQDTITFSPAAPWGTFSFDEATNILYIYPGALDGNVNYTVTVTTGVKGTDGSSLQSPLIIPFKTADLPSGSVSINANATYTASNLVTLTITANSVTTQMRYSMNKADLAGNTLPWGGLLASISNYDLNNYASGQGARTVYIQFRDNATADNRTSGTAPLSDSIFYGKPAITAVTPDTAGNVTLSWSTLARADTGTNEYRVYRRVAPPPFKSLYTMVGSTAGGSLTVSSPTEQPYNFRVAIYNSAIGTLYADQIPLSFSSNIAIVYNSDNTTDTALANSLKTVLKNSDGWKSTNRVSGTMPSWTVTLVPQDLIPTTYASYFVIYGHPVIVTHGITSYTTDGWVQNIAGNGKGLIAMGYGGAKMLDRIAALWGTAPLTSGQAPNEIGFLESMITGALAYGNAKTVGVWNSPIYRTIVSDGDRVLIGNALSRVALYRAAGTAPTGGYLYCSEDASTTYFNTVQQGRFVQYGFYGLAGVGYPAWLYSFWVDLNYRMGSAYYP
jgi:hypothetical protein